MAVKFRLPLLLLLMAGAVAALSAAGAEAFPSPGIAATSVPESNAAACPRGSKPAIIGGSFKCLRAGQPCKSRYQTAYRKYGFSCVSGHLRKRARVVAPPTPAPPPAPQPPPPPPAQPGHYKGQTSQLTIFEFDVTSEGTGVRNLVTGQVNEGCTPPAHLYGGEYKSGAATIPIASDGSFKIDFDYRGTIADAPTTGHFTITGHFSGAVASGTLSDTTNFTYQGVSYACGSGLQTWTATRTS
jgi:hypothetical protein